MLVADHPGAFRSGVSAYLVEDACYHVTEVDGMDALVAAGRTHAADVILVDSGLGQAGELQEVLRIIRSSASSTIVWGFGVNAEVVVAALRAGADGYLEKEISAPGLHRAIEAALRGEAVVPRSIIRSLVDDLRISDERSRAREIILALSPRERQVVALLGSGTPNRVIASSLEISEYTVKRHVQNILRKLDLPSRKAAAALHRFAMEGRPARAAGAEGRPVRSVAEEGPIAAGR